MSSQSASGLRKRIEHTIGKQIFKKYCQKRTENSGPMILPPIPNNKFIDKLPKGVVLEGANLDDKEHQEAYKAEVKLYRCLEEINMNNLVIHQLDYTHEQYSAFLPDHRCNKTKCKKGSEGHFCHKQARELEGECDFIVIGNKFVAVIEVKGLSLQNTEEDMIKLDGCWDSAMTQRKRMRNLIKSINPLVTVFEFTMFPNIYMEEVDEHYLSDETILFREDLENLVLIIDCCEAFSLPPVKTLNMKTAREELCRSFLGLWCVNQDNRWDLDECSLSKCVKDLDDKLRRALVTRKSVEEAELNLGLKKKKGKMKKYPQNPRMIEAPDLFKKYLKISCITQDQLDVFNSDERFFWVDGPAGSGKTVVMLSKIIHLALNTAPEKRILLILSGEEDTPAPQYALDLLNNISQDITCVMTKFDCYDVDKLDKTRSSLLQQLFDNTNKIVLLNVFSGLAKNMDRLISGFDHVFVDDHQRFDEFVSIEYGRSEFAHTNFISEGLLPVVKNRDTNKTSIWILNDQAQSFCLNHMHIMPDSYPFIALRNEFISYFVKSKLTANLRNSYEISTVLSLIRKNCFTGNRVPLVSYLPQQEIGHYLRGPKPTIYILQDHETASWTEIMFRELKNLKICGSFLKNKDIAVLHTVNADRILHSESTIISLLKKWNTAADDMITVHTTINCTSAEWPAVICICTFWAFVCTKAAVSDQSEGETTFSTTMAILYLAISRARVSSTVIFNNYKPKICKYTDKLLKELKQRRDVCRIIEL